MNKIKKHRTENGWTLQQMAVMVGASKSYIHELEQKDNPNPTIHLGIRLSKVFGLSPEYLFDDNGKG